MKLFKKRHRKDKNDKRDLELLLKDLSARLPYGVKCLYSSGVAKLIYIDVEDMTVAFDGPSDVYESICDITVYLRPLSSMTEEEQQEFESVIDTMNKYNNKNDVVIPINVIDWFNEHHFDYRDLIKQGLAQEAPEGIY